MDLLDEARGTRGQDDILTRVYKIAGHKVRVEVRRNFYADQSHATAEVLSEHMTWTVIAEDLPCNWHGPRTPLGDVATPLAQRALTILA